MKAKMSTKKFTAIWSSVVAILLVITLVANIAANIFSGYMDLFFGTGEMIITTAEGADEWDSEYYKLDYTKADVKKAANELVEEIEGEGIVLMKNNGVLPLTDKAKITLFGRSAADPVYGGSGSGAVKLDSVVDLHSGLKSARFDINETVYSILSSYTEPKGVIAMDKPEESSYYIGEMPVSGYTSEAISSFSNYNDAAVIVIGRGGGEGGDLTQDMKGWDNNYVDSQHQLELTQDELDAIALAKANFENVVVLINASSAMELGVLEDDEDIDAIVWIGSPGQTGFNAVGNVLAGTINPSGRTVDIYPADFTKDPTFVNFGDYKYTNISKSNAMGDGYFVQYEEGIYIGYRYYETAAVEGFINYDEAVVYPFGYGLSYTDFSWEVVGQKLGNEKEDITVDVKVTNTGAVSGKEVVQLYYTAPYTKGGIEKSEVVLGAFAKTGLLAPGESETVTLTLAVEEMASYDYINHKAYVLDSGDYILSLRTDSHTIKESCDTIVYNLNNTIVYSGENHRESDNIAVTNQFDDISEGIKVNMSRADFAGTFPTAPVGDDFVASETTIAGYQAYSAKNNEDPDAVMPNTNEKNGLKLIDMRGLPYDDESWELLLDQLKVDDMAKLVLNGMYATVNIRSIGKPATVDFDGPAGISSYMTSLSSTAYPSEVVIASTFNLDLVYRMGVMVGNEALVNGVNGWYAPAMNIHRSPFAGRNFEYYSEDPLLSGMMGAACVTGASTKGVYTTIKHFALNDQETNRINNGVSSWVNEQAMREIYLKPFEYTVKNSTQTISAITGEDGSRSEIEMNGATAVMSSFNRIGSTWAGGSYPLMQTVLRDEWGFEGFAITDFDLYEYMYPDQSIAAGTDLILSTDAMKSLEDTTSATAVTNLRKASKNILYTVAHSNAMNGVAPGSIITYKTAPWVFVMYAVDGVIALIAIVLIFMILNRNKKSKKVILESTNSESK
ncbi:MAG: glycoside hydrolase family 3 C-terminal domain-containing protein [Lachnospiraceae bacterium]